MRSSGKNCHRKPASASKSASTQAIRFLSVCGSACCAITPVVLEPSRLQIFPVRGRSPMPIGALYPDAATAAAAYNLAYSMLTKRHHVVHRGPYASSPDVVARQTVRVPSALLAAPGASYLCACCCVLACLGACLFVCLLVVCLCACVLFVCLFYCFTASLLHATR